MSGFDNIVIKASETPNGEIKFIEGQIGTVKSKFNEKYGATPENKCIAVCLKILSKKGTKNIDKQNLSQLLDEINIEDDNFKSLKPKIANSTYAVTDNSLYEKLLPILEAELGSVKALQNTQTEAAVTAPADEAVKPALAVTPAPAPAVTTPATEQGEPVNTPVDAQPQSGGSAQTLMNHIIDNKPNMTSMYPVKVTRRRYYRNSRGRRNGRNNRTNRRRRKSYRQLR